MPERVLLVEDDADLRTLCAGVLQRAGYDVQQADCGRVAEHLLMTCAVDVVVTDLRMPVGDGRDVLKAAKHADPETAVILMTGYPSVESAVDAMKFGAVDYLLKPVSEEQLVAAVAGGLEKRRTRETYTLLRGQLRRAFTQGGIVGRSPAMLGLFQTIRKAADVDANVLILGESGAGKERVARSIHENSDRRGRPFVAINCAAIPDSLLEAELFGHERGAFTGAHAAKEGLLEAANGGTCVFRRS